MSKAEKNAQRLLESFMENANESLDSISREETGRWFVLSTTIDFDNMSCSVKAERTNNLMPDSGYQAKNKVVNKFVEALKELNYHVISDRESEIKVCFSV